MTWTWSFEQLREWHCLVCLSLLYCFRLDYSSLDISYTYMKSYFRLTAGKAVIITYFQKLLYIDHFMYSKCTKQDVVSNFMYFASCLEPLWCNMTVFETYTTHLQLILHICNTPHICRNTGGLYAVRHQCLCVVLFQIWISWSMSRGDLKAKDAFHFPVSQSWL